MMAWRIVSVAWFATAFLAQAGGVFWSDRGASRLMRMDFDGSNLQTIALSGAVTSPGSNIRGLAVDAGSNRLFWADNGLDRLLRANLDGSSSVILYTIPGGTSFPADVRPDLPSGLLYWCDQQRFRIQRSSLDGAGVADVITNAAPTGPYFMDLDAPAGKIYWGDFDGGAIYRASLDGSGRETLLTGNNRTRGVCVDRRGGMLYWVNRDDKKIHRCPLAAFAGGTITLTHPAVQTLYTNLDTPHGLVLDVPAQKLYWADTGGNAGTGSGDKAVSRGDMDGSTPQEILAVGSEPWDVDLDRRCLSYQEWRLRCFRKDALPAQTEPAADPDLDGTSNALEYAFDLSALRADTNGLPAGLLTDGPIPGAQYPALCFRRRVGTTDLTYVVQTSSDLSTWQGGATDPKTSETNVRQLEDAMQEVTVRALSPLSGASSVFLRLVVQLGP